MRNTLKFLVFILAFTAPLAQAADKNFNVKFRQAVMEDDRLIHEYRHQPCGFRVEIVDDMDGVKPETFKDGSPYITAARGERYSVRLYNPLPVQVAVNLTVDGLNSINGKPCGIADGHKWIIEPYSSVIIPGWQVSDGDARRFFFTDKPKSYAQWRGESLGKDLAANCGVIGAAYFWNQQDLDQYYDDHPIYRYTRHYSAAFDDRAKAEKKMAAVPACPSASMANGMGLSEAQEQAGTGMGERESHPTVQVDFDFNAGMYSPSQAVVIYYGFAESPSPNPFPSFGYAPEAP